MSVAPPPLRAPGVLRGLARLRGKARLALALRGAASLLLVLLAMGLVSFALDRTLRLSWGVRATALMAILTGLGAVVWRRLLRPLSAPLPDDELARLVERSDPSLGWRLLSAVQFAAAGWTPGETSHELAAQVVAEAEALVGQVDFRRPVPDRPMVQSGLRGGALLAAGLALLVGFPDTARTWAERNLLLSTRASWPKDTHLRLVDSTPTLSGTRLKLARGDDLSLVVEAAGVVPSRVYADTISADGGEERLILDAQWDGRFRLALERVSEGFSLTLHGGDDELGPLEVVVIRRPWIEELRFEVTPPAYTGLPPRSFGVEAGAVTLPLDTQVAVRLRTSKPLRRAWLEEAGAEAAIVHSATPTGEDRRGCAAELRLDRSGAAVFSLDVEDEDGLGLERPARFSLVAQPDAPPDVKLRLVGVGLNVAPDASLRYLVEASDDYALAEGALRTRVTGGGGEGEAPRDEENRVLLSALAGKAQAGAQGRLELGPLQLQPKMALTLWAEATDRDPRGPNQGASPGYQLRVVPAEQLLAELLRRLHEQRLELERMQSEEERLVQGLRGDDGAVIERAARTHRDVGRVLNRAAEVVEGAVEEMVTNHLLDEGTWSRLREQVMEPLRALERGPLEAARQLAEGAAQAEGEARPPALAQAGEAADEVAAELRRIIARMIRIEDLAELVSHLKQIIEEQRGLLERTRREVRGGGPR